MLNSTRYTKSVSRLSVARARARVSSPSRSSSGTCAIPAANFSSSKDLVKKSSSHPDVSKAWCRTDAWEDKSLCRGSGPHLLCRNALVLQQHCGQPLAPDGLSVRRNFSVPYVGPALELGDDVVPQLLVCRIPSRRDLSARPVSQYLQSPCVRPLHVNQCDVF